MVYPARPRLPVCPQWLHTTSCRPSRPPRWRSESLRERPIPHKLFPTTTPDSFDLLSLKLSANDRTINATCAYRPPRCDHRLFCQHLEELIRAIPATTQKIILTDFNAKNAAWCHSDTTDAVGEDLAVRFQTYSLHQHVTFPTLVQNGHLKSCLGLAVMDVDSDYVLISGLPQIGNSDHLSIRGLIKPVAAPPRAVPPPNHNTTHWKWSDQSISSLKAEIERTQLLPEGDTLNTTNIDNLWHSWKHKVLTCACKHCAVPHSPRHASHPAKPWLNPELTNSIREKHWLYRAYLRTRAPCNWTAYTIQRNKVTHLLRITKSTYVSNGTGTSHSTPNLHKLMRSLQSSKRPTLPDTFSQGQTLSTPAEKRFLHLAEPTVSHRVSRGTPLHSFPHTQYT